MKNTRRLFKLFSFAFILSVFLISNVKATTVSFPGMKVPARQTYATLDDAKKSESSSNGIVNLTRMEVDGVTFSARAVANGHSYGSGKVVTQTNTNFIVNYTATYGAGQKMQARFRNHNWTLTGSKIISGTFNYK